MVAQLTSIGSDPLERRKGESELAYDAFLVYRSLGGDRTLGKLHARLAQDSSDKKKPTMATIEHWSSKFRWADRLRQLSTIKGHELADTLNTAHAEIVELFRSDLEQQGKELMATAKSMRALIDLKIAELQTKDLAPGDIPGYLRAAVAAYQYGSEIRAQAIGVTNLLEQVTATQS